MPVLTLQRAYKYIMYATKSPSLRIKQADLKCKNGCGFYGTADWGGYCSICHRNSLQSERQRKAGHHSEHARAAVSGFSKFEEKKRQQSDKAKKYLKPLAVFRKSSSAKDTGRPDIYQELKKPNPETDKLKLEYKETFGFLGHDIEKDIDMCIQAFCVTMRQNFDLKTIDELGEYAQKCYKTFSRRMEDHERNTIYNNVSPEIREQLLDFFEKFTMSCLYRVLFCPTTTSDEEKDLAIQDRIRALSWVNAHNLDCRISERSVEVRELVYTAITDLLNMDSMKAPQDKLACVVKCCRSVVLVLQQCQGGPVSADEFLPALIFIVLKANPARLKSNIHYVTRFCNDVRLLQGEGGYYFTNLCCAVSFIENLTAESLSMSEEEFSACMSGKVTVVSAWESALVACESMHQLCEHLSLLKTLTDRNTTIQEGAKEISIEIDNFKENIESQVAAVLQRTPLIIKPRKTPVALDKDDSISDNLPPPISPTIMITPTDVTNEIVPKSPQTEVETDSLLKSETEPTKNFYTQNLQMQPLNLGDENEKKKGLTLDVNSTETETSVSKEIMNKSESSEFLSPSPVFQFSNFDSQNFDMLVTPDDIANNSFLMGLSNVNYDIEFSDISAENSIAEDPSPDKLVKSPIQRDPFSPVDNKSCNISQLPLIPSNVNSFSRESPFSAAPSTSNTAQTSHTQESEEMSSSLIDNIETSSPENLPSPIKPVSSEYSGFSTQGWQIPNIPCHTGDYNSINVSSASQSTVHVTAVQNGVLENTKTKDIVNNDDSAVRLLGGVLETLDKLF